MAVILFKLLSLPAPAAAGAAPPAPQVPQPPAAAEDSVNAIMLKAESFEKNIEQAIFSFEEEFLLIPTGEKEKIEGRVYLDRKNNRVHIEYKGRVKAKVWIFEDKIYFYDADLEQVVVQGWKEFHENHFQAFMDIPIIFNLGRFKERYEVGPAGGAETAAVAGTVFVKAVPKNASGHYYLLIGFSDNTGQPQSLELVMENYRARVRLFAFNPKAKIHDKMFNLKFPERVAVLDLTKEKSGSHGERSTNR